MTEVGQLRYLADALEAADKAGLQLNAATMNSLDGALMVMERLFHVGPKLGHIAWRRQRDLIHRMRALADMLVGYRTADWDLQPGTRQTLNSLLQDIAHMLGFQVNKR